MDAETFSDFAAELCRRGATVLGGCCGTTPEYIAKAIEKTKDIPYALPEKKEKTVVSSYTHSVEIGGIPVLIGERINPTGKKKLKEALRAGDMNYILGEAVKQEEKGVQILDINVGLPEIDEAAMMMAAVRGVQAVTDLPLQIDSSDPAVLCAAMRIYNGKPLVNSVNAKEESMSAVFPLVKKYGGAVIGLTIGEEGIPDTAEGRVALAERILARAADFGIEKKDIIIDPLAMAVSSDAKSARVTLEAVRLLHERGIRTSLGVSNISFGLPERDYINTTFYANAMELGLDCAIMNPFSVGMMGVYKAFLALNGLDSAFGGYIAFAEENPLASNSALGIGKATGPSGGSKEVEGGLKGAVIHGLKEETVKETEALMGQIQPMEIVNGYIIPALNEIGTAFEEKRAYLPQLLMSAEAAALAFDVVKKGLKQTESDGAKKEFILATVKGDIHDIGKNIVKVMLESYGFTVHDLGRDVPPEAVAACVRETGCRLVGLSALMTTTVPAMEETIRAVKAEFPDAVIVVGGAVLTKEYADRIGADYYAADAMETVRIAEETGLQH
jgi:5-methyltetrahydrofolate--homocysteine methyltransferase